MLKGRVFCEMGWNSDIAVYLKGRDYHIIVADTRPDIEIPEGEDEVDAYIENVKEFEEKVRSARRIPIGLPHDGVEAVFSNAAAACEFVVLLKAEGYRIPNSVARELFVYSEYEKLYY